MQAAYPPRHRAQVLFALQAKANYRSIEEGAHERARHVRVKFAGNVLDIQQVRDPIDVHWATIPGVGDRLLGLRQVVSLFQCLHLEGKV